MLRTVDNTAVIIDYAESIAPSGDHSFLSEVDRSAIVSLHRWSLDRQFEQSDNLVILVAEHLSDVAPRLLSNPRIRVIDVPLPDKDERAGIIRLLERDATEREIERLASYSAGLKNIQVRGLLAPGRRF